MKTVLVSGNFNVLHTGHLRLLRFARECGDRLVVAVHSDRIAGSAAHVPQELRLEGVLANSYVSEAFIIDEPISVLISRLKPDILVKGREHENQFNPEKEVLETYGGTLIFSSGEAIFSSSQLLQRDFLHANLSSITFPSAYAHRQKITTQRLRKIIDSYSSLRVLVIGDLIIDEYISCDPLGMSQEDPTIVVTPVDSKKFLGGAGIVAAHASSLGAKVKFISVSGDDETKDFSQEKLKEYGVEATLIIDKNRPTTLKQRYRCKGKTLLRVSHLHQSSISIELQKEMLDNVSREVKNCDLIVFSDFNYGSLPQIVVDGIIAMGKEHGIMMAADSQSSSQIGNVARFHEMDLITATEHEARLSTRNNDEGLVTMVEDLRKTADANNILLKLGEDGVLIHHVENKIKTDSWMNDNIEALNSSPKDVAGAGDSMLITSAMALALKATIWESAFIGALAAAIQVGRIGNTPIIMDEMLSELAHFEKL